MVKAYGNPAAEEITKEGVTIWGYKRADESTLVIHLSPEKKLSFFEILYAPISPYRKKMYDGTQALAPKGEWNSRQFAMDGVLFTMPYAYADLQKLGWIPRKEIDQKDLEKFLAPGAAAAELVQLKHPFYGQTLLLGFVNKTSVNAPVKNTQILYFSISENAGEKKKPLPFLMLPKGITWGSTIEEVEAAYGKPSQKVDEGKKVSLVYEDEKKLVLDMTFENGGLKDFIYFDRMK